MNNKRKPEQRTEKTEHIKAVIEAFLKQSGMDKGLNKHHVIKSWENIVGERINTATQNIYFKNDILYVKITSPIVKNELRMIKSAIIERINRSAGYDIVKDIFIR